MASSRCEQSLDIFRLLFTKMSEKDHIASLYGWVTAAQKFWASIFSLSLKKLHSRLIHYRIYIVKTTWGLIIKNVWHVSTNITDTIWNVRLRCRDRSSLLISEHKRQPNGGILDIKIIFIEQKEHLLCNWESRECKHPKIIKGKWFILLLFWLLWPFYFAASCW